MLRSFYSCSELTLSLIRAQYANLVGMLGRWGKYGLSTLYVEDVRHFYLNEDLPSAYMRRELPV